MAKKSLLMISYPFPPTASAGAVRSERFARYLGKLGWSVDVITIKPRKDLFHDFNRVHNLGPNISVHPTSTFDPWLMLRDKRPSNIIIRAIRSIFMRIFSFPDHMATWIPFAVKAGLKICNQKKIDAIYTTSPPHSSHLAGLILSRMKKIPWVADFRDPWTLNAYREEKSRLDHYLTMIEKQLEKAVLKNASRILANTQANRTNLLNAFTSLNEEKVIHLPNGWEEFPNPEKYNRKDGPFTIIHAGTFYPRFKPYTLFYALAKWKKEELRHGIPPVKQGDIKVILLGARDPETAKIIQELTLEDLVEIRPWTEQEEARKMMCQADMLMASLGTGLESSTYVPSKLFEYIAAKRPIIGFFPDGEAARLIQETNSGKVFTNDDSEPILKFLSECITKKDFSYSPNKEKINSYHIQQLVLKLARILDEIQKNG